MTRYGETLLFGSVGHNQTLDTPPNLPTCVALHPEAQMSSSCVYTSQGVVCCLCVTRHSQDHCIIQKPWEACGSSFCAFNSKWRCLSFHFSLTRYTYKLVPMWTEHRQDWLYLAGPAFASLTDQLQGHITPQSRACNFCAQNSSPKPPPLSLSFLVLEHCMNATQRLSVVPRTVLCGTPPAGGAAPCSAWPGSPALPLLNHL